MCKSIDAILQSIECEIALCLKKSIYINYKYFIAEKY